MTLAARSGSPRRASPKLREQAQRSKAARRSCRLCRCFLLDRPSTVPFPHNRYNVNAIEPPPYVCSDLHYLCRRFKRAKLGTGRGQTARKRPRAGVCLPCSAVAGLLPVFRPCGVSPQDTKCRAVQRMPSWRGWFVGPRRQWAVMRRVGRIPYAVYADHRGSLTRRAEAHFLTARSNRASENGGSDTQLPTRQILGYVMPSNG